MTAIALNERHLTSMAGLAPFSALRALNLADNEIAAIEGLDGNSVAAPNLRHILSKSLTF